MIFFQYFNFLCKICMSENFFYSSVTVVLIFPPIAILCLIQPMVPKTIPNPLSLFMGPLYMVLDFLLLSPVTLSSLPSGHCQLCLFFFLIFIVIQLQLSAFSPHPSTPPQPNPPPSPVSTLPLDFVHVSFMVVLINPSPHCSLPTPLWLLLDCA